MWSGPTGSDSTVLIVIRGNSGSGKSSIARQLQMRHGRGCAWVEQDYLRRIVLRERDKAGGLAPVLIDQTVRTALDHGYHVVLDGILRASRYSPMLTSLCHDHRGRTTAFYLDVSLSETLRRHRTRPQADRFSTTDMRGWYVPHDLLGIDGEHVLHENTSLEEAVHQIATTAGLPLDERHDDFLPLDAPTPETPRRTPLA
jgi:predicted kinase